jgi:hypothetical protein
MTSDGIAAPSTQVKDVQDKVETQKQEVECRKAKMFDASSDLAGATFVAIASTMGSEQISQGDLFSWQLPVFMDWAAPFVSEVSSVLPSVLIPALTVVPVAVYLNPAFSEYLKAKQELSYAKAGLAFQENVQAEATALAVLPFIASILTSYLFYLQYINTRMSCDNDSI